MKRNCAVILAAGEGTRMKSLKPKAMAEVLFKPMIDWVTDCVKKSGIEDICVITGHLGEILTAHLDDTIETAVQTQRLGTGHAVMQAKDFLSRHTGGNVLILNADAPFIDTKTVTDALSFHENSENGATVISAKIDNPFGYGRIVRTGDGALEKIVEQKEANEQEQAITEVNSGAYWFNCTLLLKAMDRLAEIRQNSSEKKEYYLTDAIEILRNMGQKTNAFTAGSPEIILGANDRRQLLELNEIARQKELQKHMLNGVSIPCTDGVLIGPGVEIERETVILPGTILKGKTKIASCCTIGPNSIIEDCQIGEYTVINSAHCYQSAVGKNSDIGPFVRLRPNCKVGDKVHIGNFVELKNTSVDTETKISHLSYVGDSSVGRDVNIGCGCATVNFNGVDKNKTVIGDGAFIGCGTNLVAPVEVGNNSYIAAGSTIVEDIPDDALAIARSRQVVKIDWVKKKKPYRRMRK